jgi:bifunctional enzyme CysN/CysC
MATLLKKFEAPTAESHELERWIEATQRKSLLRFITCGSVDDGKSTLIGRLLYDSKLLFEDQLLALASESKMQGRESEELDFALLVDGLAAEREQGITIDVAYRFFSTDRRKFIVADTPGHEQYTRNMVTGASTADAAVILVDARKGVLTQTRRHSTLVHLLGIRNIILAVNKMDLVGYDQAAFDLIVEDYGRFARAAGIGEFTAIPLSGLKGDNVIRRSPAMGWYDGPALLEQLESIRLLPREPGGQSFRMAVQWVSRPDQDFRGYAGRIASGRVHTGDAVAILPSGRKTFVERIVAMHGDLDHGVAGQSVMLTLADEIDCSRGDMIVAADDEARAVSRIGASLVWMSDQKLVPRRSYWLKIGTQMVSASIDAIDSIIDVNRLGTRPGEPLGLNDIGSVVIELDRGVPAIRYADNRKLGGFILIDKLSNATVAAGLVERFPQDASNDRATRLEDVVWVFGPDRFAWASAAAARLKAQGRAAILIDDAAVAAFPGEEPVRPAREIARLVAAAGLSALITVEASPDEAHPGRTVDSSEAEFGGDEWVI